MKCSKGISVDYKGIRPTIKGKQTKIRAIDITFKPVGLTTMTLHQDTLRINILFKIGILFVFLRPKVSTEICGLKTI